MIKLNRKVMKMTIKTREHRELMMMFEKEYKQFNFLDRTTQLIQKAINNGEIKDKNAATLSFYLFSFTGATIDYEW